VLVVGTGTDLAGGWNAAALGAAAVSALGALTVAALRPARR
jgi:hypothetical protein